MIEHKQIFIDNRWVDSDGRESLPVVNPFTEAVIAPDQQARGFFLARSDCVLVGLFLLHRDGVPVVVVVRPGRYSSNLPVLEVVAGSREAARGTLAALLDEARNTSVYKGHTVLVENGQPLSPLSGLPADGPDAVSVRSLATMSLPRCTAQPL